MSDPASDRWSGHLSLSIRFDAAVVWRMRKACFGGLTIALFEGKSQRLPEWAA